MLFEDAVAEYMADKSRRLRATTLAGVELANLIHAILAAGYGITRRR